MKASARILFLTITLVVAPSISAAEAPDPIPITSQIAPGVWMIPEVPVPDRAPDGNSVAYAVPDGLVVVDTGRHLWHREAILALAQQQRRAIIAVVNSHWHLDHVSGNPALRKRFPQMRVYASGAIDQALDGFLASSARDTARYVDDPTIPAATRADLGADLLTIQLGAALKPDIVIDASRSIRIGRHPFKVNLAPYAATSGDVWLYDETSGVAALGDLVTLPVPYLDTACPAGWSAALAAVAATPFQVAIPGHGAPLTHVEFATYQLSFERFLECAASARGNDDCGAQWARDVGPLIGHDDAVRHRAEQGAAYYVDLIRSGGGRSRYCEEANHAA
jgi:glyoxylase-like metal-dependent hydrolase (beta-lactamase superfamily II)